VSFFLLLCIKKFVVTSCFKMCILFSCPRFIGIIDVAAADDDDDDDDDDDIYQLCVSVVDRTMVITGMRNHSSRSISTIHS